MTQPNLFNDREKPVKSLGNDDIYQTVFYKEFGPETKLGQILAVLQKGGRGGCTTLELIAVSHRFSASIHALRRKHGFEIVTSKLADGSYRFILTGRRKP